MTAVAEGPAVRGASGRHRKPLLQSEQSQGLALVSPTLLYAILLLVAPIAVVIAYSFWTQVFLTIDRTFTLEQYRIALTEPIYRDLLMRSLWVSLLVSLITVALAYPIAYYISFHGGSHKSLWIFLITIPVVNSSIAVNLPREPNRAQDAGAENVIITVDAQGAIYWFETRLPDTQILASLLGTVATMRPQPEVHIRGDVRADYQAVGQVVRAAQQAGIANVGFLTEPPGR